MARNENQQQSPSKLAVEVTFPAYIRGVPGSNHIWDKDKPEILGHLPNFSSQMTV
jgi:hypothetical protein